MMKYDKEYRHLNYKRLRNVGFNSHEANKFKDYKIEVVDNLIALRMTFNAKVKELTGVRIDNDIYEINGNVMTKINSNVED